MQAKKETAEAFWGALELLGSQANNWDAALFLLLSAVGIAVGGYAGFRLMAWVKRDRRVEKVEAKAAEANAAREEASEELSSSEDRIGWLKEAVIDNAFALKQARVKSREITKKLAAAKKAADAAEEEVVEVRKSEADRAEAKAKAKADVLKRRIAPVVKGAAIVAVPFVAFVIGIQMAWLKAMKTLGLVSMKEFEAKLELKAALQSDVDVDVDEMVDLTMATALETEQKQNKMLKRALDSALEKLEAQNGLVLAGYSFDVSEKVTLAAVEAAVLKEAELKCSASLLKKLRGRYSAPRIGGKGRTGSTKAEVWEHICSKAKEVDEHLIPIGELKTVTHRQTV